MSVPKVPPLHDVVRLTDPSSVDHTVAAVRLHVDRGPSQFNYEPVRAIAPQARIRTLPKDQFTSACMKSRNPKGRLQNAEVAGLVWDIGRKVESSIYAPERRLFVIRADLSIRFQPDAFFIEDGRVVFFWLQPRSGFALNIYQLRVIATVLRRLYIVGDFEHAELEILDCRAIDGEREATRYCLADLEPVTQGELDAHFQVFADAWDKVVATYQPRPREERELRVDPKQDDLFK
jgi:hypothetical protein